MMRHLRHIFIAVLAAASLLSCVREDNLQEERASGIKAKEGCVIIDGSVSLPVAEDAVWMTRAFVEKPTVQRLYVAVFNAGDILYEIRQAKPGTQSHPTNPNAGFACGEKATNYLTKFHVELQAVSQGDRYVHFIATSSPIASLENATVNMMDEATFVHDLVTSNAVVAYWGRVHVSSITETTDFQDIPMIRNFVKVKISSESIANFSIQGFKVFDTPVYGTIAPFNNNTPDYITVDGADQINFNRFADYVSAVQHPRPYTWFANDNHYYGFMPPIVEYDNLGSYYDAAGTDNVPWLSPDEPDYLYECSYRPDRNPFIILKATYRGNPCYYKADFVFEGENGSEYYNLLRNFQYTLHITGVNGKGSSTVFDAVNSIALNNFEASTLSQELTNIALDDSRLYVSKTDVMVTHGTTFTMYVKSRTGATFTTNDNNSITAEIREPSSGSYIVADAAQISIAGSDDTSGKYDGWRKVTITIHDPSTLQQGEVWKQPIVFKNGSGLTRTVNLTLRKPFPLTVDMQDVVSGTKNTECELKFTIPAGLTAYRFPMYFMIEQEQNNLYPKALPDGSYEFLTVETGTSNIPNNTGNTYYYIRQVTWDEYSAANADINGIKTFSCYFKTIKDASATTVWVIPMEESNYFDPFDHVENDYTNKDSFLNNKLAGKITFQYSSLQLQPSTSALNVATSNSGNGVSYNSSNTAVATVDATGKVTAHAVGNATITATCAESGSYTQATASYNVNVTEDNLTGLSLKWYTEPGYVLKVGQSIHGPIAVASVDAGYDASNVTISYSSSPAGIINVDETNSETLHYVTVTGTAAGVVTVTATATAAAADGYAATTRSISYDLYVVAAHPDKGTVYHNETFLGPDFGDYSIIYEKVTDGATYNTGTDVTNLFNTYTTYNVGTGYDPRHVWYPYYNKSSQEGYGAAASAYGSTQEATSSYVDGNLVWDYHNQYYASQTQLASKDIDLSCSAGAQLTFYHAGNYFFNTATNEDIADAQTIMAGDVGVIFSADGGSTWSGRQTIMFYPSGSNWVYVRTSVDIPAAFLTSQFRFAFDYTSTNTRAGTWEIKNVKITEK